MARDLYDILDIPETATVAWIKRAHELRRDIVNADATLSDKQRRVELLAIDEAFRTLSNSAAREAYDRRLQNRNQPPAAHSILALLLSPGALAFTFVCLLGATVYYYNYNAEQGRLRIEQERIAAENERYTKELEAREQREAERAAQVAENKRLQQEKALRAQFERDRRDLDKWQRNVSYEMQRSARDQELADERARREEERAEYRDREAQAERRRQAFEELERQKRFLRELERR
jgi:curved DNA-binding protein CbpA